MIIMLKVKLKLENFKNKCNNYKSPKFINLKIYNMKKIFEEYNKNNYKL